MKTFFPNVTIAIKITRITTPKELLVTLWFKSMSKFIWTWKIAFFKLYLETNCKLECLSNITLFQCENENLTQFNHKYVIKIK